MAADDPPAANPDQLRAQRRAAVLRLCEEEQQAWQQKPGRNLVLLFDGTGNILGNSEDTNVVRLLRMVNKQAPYQHAQAQVAYYDPGVGTVADDFPPEGFAAKFRARLALLWGLLAGRGAFENVAEGYQFLCREYTPGDRIWLFGFSRGAFTARAVGGMVNMYGLVGAAGFPLVNTLVRTYFSRERPARDAFAKDVIENFTGGRTPLVHFTGVWDTVESVGLTGSVRITNSRRFEHKRFVHVRHALSLHETRQKYAPRDYVPPEFTAQEQQVRSFDQRWFRGVHSDVGGSYREDRLSNIALNWMAREAQHCGLELATVLHPEDARQAMHDQVLESPYWILAGVNARDRHAIRGQMDPSAVPIEGATPAQRAPQGKLARPWGILVSLLTLVSLGFAAWADKAACTGGPNWLAWVATPYQLLAPWITSLGLSCPPDAVARAIRWDWFFLACYWPWLPYPLGWALRRWCASAIVRNETLPAFAAKVHLVLWALLAADILENVLTLHLPQWTVAIMLLCVAKLACVAWIACVIVAGARRGRAEPAGALPVPAPE